MHTSQLIIKIAKELVEKCNLTTLLREFGIYVYVSVYKYRETFSLVRALILFIYFYADTFLNYKI